jgi:hypothetical protein
MKSERVGVIQSVIKSGHTSILEHVSLHLHCIWYEPSSEDTSSFAIASCLQQSRVNVPSLRAELGVVIPDSILENSVAL